MSNSQFWENPWIISFGSSFATFWLGVWGRFLLDCLTKYRLCKLLWQCRGKDALTVVHGGYDDIGPISKNIRPAGTRQFTLRQPTDLVELLPFCEISKCWSPLHHQPISFETDSSLDNVFDKNMLALGGPDYNIKSYDILEKNKFIQVWPRAGEKIVIDQKEMPFVSGRGKDEYGFIMRITSPMQKSWMICAGFGAEGTTGAGCFFAKNWSMMLQIISPFSSLPLVSVPDFLFVIKFLNRNSEEGQIVAVFTEKNNTVSEIKKGHFSRKRIIGYSE